MKLSDFIQDLKLPGITWVQAADRDMEIYSFKPFPLSSHFENNMVYIGAVSELTDEYNDHPLSFLCTIKESDSFSPEPFASSHPNCNLVLLAEDYSDRTMFDFASGVFLAETRYTSYINRIVAASNSNRGLQYLVDEACKITENPITIMDSSYKVLAMFNDYKIDLRPDLEEQRKLGYLTEQNLEDLKRDKIYETLRQSQYPVYKKAEGAPYGWLNVLVYVHNIEVAEIGMIEYSHPFTRYDFEFLNFFKQLVSWELKKDDFYKDNLGMMHSLFLAELLERQIPNHQIVEFRKKQLNWKDAPFMYVLTIFQTDSIDFKKRAEIFAAQLRHIFTNSRWVVYNSNLVLLIMKDDEDLKDFSEESSLWQRLASNQMYAVISSCFTDLLDIRKYYDQTVSINELLTVIKEKKAVYLYNDYIFFHIGKIISEKYSLEDFYHSAIKRMRQYDMENSTFYVDTLSEYLLHVDNPAVCAKNLFIHKNTFFYRMNKIRDIFQLDLNDGMERLKLHLTLELMKLE